MTGNLARRYARALLELAREAGTLDASGQEVAAAAAVFSEPRLRAVVLNPAIQGGARRKIVGDVVAALGVSGDVGNLVKLLADRGRLQLLGGVVLDIGGTVWDGSLRTQLARMSTQLVESG